jgi:hypothetical protein
LYQQSYNCILLLPLAPREEEEDVQLAEGFCARPGWPAGPFMGNIRNAFPFIVKFKYICTSPYKRKNS